MANDLRDFTANRLTEVCPNVCIDPTLQALTGELLSHNSSNSEDGEMTSFFTVQHVGADPCQARGHVWSAIVVLVVIRSALLFIC